jgi:hypothetical protein
MKKITNYGSSFWLDDDFDTDFTSWDDSGTRKRKVIDHTKLASTQRAISNFVNIVTGKQIPVRFQSADSSYTDGETVTIGTKLEGKNFDSAVGLALHEGSHIAFTDFNILKNCNQIGSAFHSAVAMQGCDPDMNMNSEQLMIIKDILNWVEDRRIDYRIYTTAPGYRVYYEAMYDKYFNDKVIDKALESGEKCEETWDDYLFHIINFTNPNRQLDALKALRSIWNVVDLKHINRLKNTQDALVVSCEIYKLIKKAVAEEESQNQGSGQSNEESQEQNDSQASGSGQGDDIPEDAEFEVAEGDGAGGSRQSSSNLSPVHQRKLEKAIQKQREFLNDDAKKTGRLSKKDARVVETLKNSGTESREVNAGGSESAPTPIQTTVIKKLNQAVVMTLDDMFDTYTAEKVFTQGIDPLNPEKWGFRHYQDMHKAVTEGIVLGRQLGQKLQIRNEERSLKSTRLQSGKIDRRLVSSLGFGNDSVFHRIVTDRFKNFFIHISIDASGSMGGKRFENAIKSAVAVAQAASMTTGIRVQISLRGTTGIYNSGSSKSTTLYAYDSAHDKMSKIKTLFPCLKTFGMTPEGIAFESIYRDIKKDAKGDECIFINYSDGMPGGVDGVSYYWDGVEYTRRVVNKMREIGINIISYFIDGDSESYSADSFRRMYGQEAEFIDPTSLTKVSRSLNRKFLELGEAA